MQALPIRIFLILLILAFLYPSSLSATTERRTALVIGNSTYSFGPLKNPVNDATDMASTLERLGFDVILKKNARMQDMEDAIREFGSRLKRGGEGLFFYAGHGVQIGGKNYLLPIGAKINRETDAKYQAIDAEMVLDEMANAGNNVNIVILDACRDNPLGRSLRSVGRGLAIISDAPHGTLITYSTSPGKTAEDGEGRNSPYTKALLKYMTEPGQPVEQVFKRVRQTVAAQSGGKQIPWELSSLRGEFYFVPGKLSSTVITTTPVPESDKHLEDVKPETTDFYDEQRKIEAEKDKLRRERELLEQRESLVEETRKLEEKNKQLSTVARPSVSKANEIRRDERFIAHDNGTIAAADLKVGGRAAGFNLKDSEGVEYTLDSPKYKGRVVVIFYADRGSADLNDDLQRTLIAARESGKIDKTHYQGLGVLNLKDSILPNFVLRSGLKRRQEENKAVIYLLDPDYTMLNLWGLTSKTSNIIMLDKQRICRYLYKGKVPAADIEKIIALI